MLNIIDFTLLSVNVLGSEVFEQEGVMADCLGKEQLKDCTGKWTECHFEVSNLCSGTL